MPLFVGRALFFAGWMIPVAVFIAVLRPPAHGTLAGSVRGQRCRHGGQQGAAPRRRQVAWQRVRFGQNPETGAQLRPACGTVTVPAGGRVVVLFRGERLRCRVPRVFVLLVVRPVVAVVGRGRGQGIQRVGGGLPLRCVLGDGLGERDGRFNAGWKAGRKVSGNTHRPGVQWA